MKILEQMDAFTPRTEHQKRAYDLLRALVSEKRFNNDHTRGFYERHRDYISRIDELTSVLLSEPVDSMQLIEFVEEFYIMGLREIRKIMETQHLSGLSADLGHGLIAPLGSL